MPGGHAYPTVQAKPLLPRAVASEHRVKTAEHGRVQRSPGRAPLEPPVGLYKSASPPLLLSARPGVCSCGDEASDELPLQQLTVDDASEQARLGARRDSASTDGAPPLHTAAIALHQSLFISGEAAASVTVPAVCRTCHG